MEYKRPTPGAQEVKFKPRLIIHGGAGNIPGRDKMSPETYAEYRESLLRIVGWPIRFYSSIMQLLNWLASSTHQPASKQTQNRGQLIH